MNSGLTGSLREAKKAGDMAANGGRWRRMAVNGGYYVID
jgi:hypothetical protein